MSDVYLLARGSVRGWSDIEGKMTSEEADWITKHGRYQAVSQRLMQAISSSQIDEMLAREFGEDNE